MKEKGFGTHVRDMNFGELMDYTDYIEYYESFYEQ